MTRQHFIYKKGTRKIKAKVKRVKLLARSAKIGGNEKP